MSAHINDVMMIVTDGLLRGPHSKAPNTLLRDFEDGVGGFPSLIAKESDSDGLRGGIMGEVQC